MSSCIQQLCSHTTLSVSLLAGFSSVARLALTAAGGPGEDRDAVVPAGGAAARAVLLLILLPGPPQVWEPRLGLVRCSAEAYKLIHWYGLDMWGARTQMC